MLMFLYGINVFQSEINAGSRRASSYRRVSIGVTIAMLMS
jgi:hypothetical protein